MRFKIGSNVFSLADIAIIAHIFSLYFLYSVTTSIFSYIIALIAITLVLIEYGLPQKVDVLSKQYFLFVILCFASVFYSVNMAASLKRTELVFLMWISMFCIFIYSSHWDNLEKIKKAFTYVGPMLVVYVILKNGFSISNSFRFGHGIINENTMAFGLMISGSITYKNILRDRWKLFYIVLLCIDFVGIFLCSSRTVFFAISIEFVLTYFMFYGFDRRKIIRAILLIVFAIGMITVLNHFSERNDAIYVSMNRLTSIFDIIKGSSDDLSVNSRSKMVSFGMTCFMEKPLLGHGIDAFKSLYPLKEAYAHNNYVELLVDTGIIGLILYYSLFITAGVKTFKSWRSSRGVSFFPLIFSVLILGFGSVYYDLATVVYILVISCKDSEQQNI